jgi:hypothetical protein
MKHLEMKQFVKATRLITPFLVAFSALTLSYLAQATAGALDFTFGTGGKVTTSFAGGEGTASAIAIQADGKIVAQELPTYLTAVHLLTLR